MLKLNVSGRLAALFVVLCIPVIARAQTLADRVPADSIIYVGWAGIDSNAPGFAGSDFQAMLADSNIPAVIDDFIPRVLDRIAREDKDAAQAVEIVRTVIGPMWRHPSALSFQGVAVDPNKGPMPKFVLMCQAGNDSAALKAKLEDLLKMAGQPPFPVGIIQKGDLVALVVGYAKPEDGIADAGGKSLATDPNFIASLAQVSKGSFATFYLDAEKLFGLVDMGTAMAGDEVKKSWEKANDLLGLKGVKRVIVTTGFDGKEWGSKAFIAAPAPRSGFIGSLIDGKPLSDKIIETIPANATIAGAVHFDLAGLVAGLRTAVAAIDPNSAKEFDKGLDEVNKTVGMDVQKDLLGNLGDEWAYYADPAVAGNGMIGLTGVNRLKDAAAAEAALTKLEEFINKAIADAMKGEKMTLAIRQTKVGAVTVHYLGAPLISPAWAIHDGNLYFSAYPEVTLAAANHVAGKGKSIADNPEYMKLHKRLGDHAASSIAFVDLPRRLPDTYGSWLVISHITGTGDLFGVPSPIQILPPMNKLATHLSAAGQITWTDADGLHASGLTPFPGADVFGSDPMSMSGAQLPLMISIMLPAMNKARQQAIRVKSASNLRQIGLGALQYANANNGKFPKDMGELPQFDIALDVFVNPAGGAVIPAGLPQPQQSQWVREHSDYIWNGEGKTSAIGADEPLAWENPNAARDGINILYGDGHVAWFSMFEARDIIAKAQTKAKGL